MKFLLLSTALAGADPMLYEDRATCTEAAEKITLTMGLGEATCIPAPMNLQQDPAEVFANMIKLINSQKRLTQDQTDRIITE